MINDEIIPREHIINGDDQKEEYARYILQTEPHHNHPIVRHEGRLYWKEDAAIRKLIGRDRLDLGDLVDLMGLLGMGANSETMRKMYRCMGYSLSGYYDIFYEEVNNSYMNEYLPNEIP